MNQSELVKQMSHKQLKQSLYMSQIMFLCIGIILSVFLFDHLTNWFDYFKWNTNELFYYGVVPGLIVVAIDVILMIFLPKRFYDDGGINEKLFKNSSIVDVFFISLIVAISEEILFRGVLQTVFGYIIASTIFALVHVRYLKKPVLLVSVLLLSFYIGYLFEITENLFVTMIAHFTIDFLLGLIIRFQK